MLLEAYRKKIRNFFTSPMWYLLLAAVVIAIIHLIAREIPLWATLLLCLAGAMFVLWMLRLLKLSFWMIAGVIALGLFTLWNVRWITLLILQPQVISFMMALVGVVVADFVVTIWQMNAQRQIVATRVPH